MASFGEGRMPKVFIVQASRPEWPAQQVPVDGNRHITVQLAFRVTGIEDFVTDVVIHFVSAERETGVPVKLRFNVRTPSEAWTMPAQERIRHAIRTALEHEIDESLRVDGARVFDPHAGDIPEDGRGYGDPHR